MVFRVCFVVIALEAGTEVSAIALVMSHKPYPCSPLVKGWHQYTSYQGQQIAFSLVGVPTDGMLRACAFDQLQSGPTPNGNRHVDAMINVVAHEMVRG